HHARACLARLAYHSHLLLLRIPPHPPRPTLFPYTTLFRADTTGNAGADQEGRLFRGGPDPAERQGQQRQDAGADEEVGDNGFGRSEEHTSQLQSRENLVCRLLLEKKKSKEQALRDTEQYSN